MTDPQVILVGASCRAAAQALKGLGISSLAWDLFADRDTSNLCSVHQIESFESIALDSLLKLPKSFVLPCGGLENAHSLWETLEQHHRMLGPNFEQLRKMRDPIFLQSFCLNSKSGIKFPESLRHSNSLSAEKQWIIKNTLSAGGLGIRNLGAHPLNSSEYYQERIEGAEFSVTYSCGSGAAKLLQSSIPLPSMLNNINRPYCYAGSIGPVSLGDGKITELDHFFESLSTDLQYRGVLQGDFIIRADEIYLLEINPRWTASMEIAETLSPGSILSHFMTQDRGTAFEPPLLGGIQDLGRVAKQIVYSDRSLFVNDSISDRWMNHSHWQARCEDNIEFRYRLADIPNVESAIEPGHPLCTVLIRLDEELGWPNENERQLEKLQKILRSIDPLRLVAID